MKDYAHFPPIRYFTRILNNNPKCAKLYTQLWANQDAFNQLKVGRKNTRKEYLISPTLFRNLLSAMMSMNLLSFVETEEEFQIEVFGSQQDV